MPTTNALFSNFNKTTLASPLSSSSTTITVAAGTGANFPVPTGTQYFALVLNDALTGNVFEIVKVTTVSGDTLTVVRGQEGTSPTNWLAGDFCWCGPTAGSILSCAEFPSLLSSNGWKKYPDPNSANGYFIEQWGTGSTNNNVRVNFPISFPNACFNVQVTEANGNSATWGSGLPDVHAVSTVNVNGFDHWTVSWNGSAWVGPTGGNAYYYRAIGY